MANIKISELPVASGPVEDDDIVVLVRGGVTYQMSGEDHNTAGVVSFNQRQGVVTLEDTDITSALGYVPVGVNGSNNILYGTNASGQQAAMLYSRSATPLAFAQRGSVGTLQAVTVADGHSQATDNDLVNRSYVQDLRADRITTVSSNVVSYTIPVDRDGIIISGLNTVPLALTLPSGLTKYKRVLTKFTTDVSTLTVNAGQNSSNAPNSIDYSPTSAQAGDLFEWGYDVSTSTWLITNYVSFNSLP